MSTQLPNISTLWEKMVHIQQYIQYIGQENGSLEGRGKPIIKANQN